MARRRKAGSRSEDPEGKVELVVPRGDAEARLSSQIEKGRELYQRAIGSELDLESPRQDFYTWCDFTEELLRRLFSDSSLSEEFSHNIGFFIAGGPQPFGEEVREFRDDVQKKLRRLESIQQRLELIPESSETESSDTTTRGAVGDGMVTPRAESKKVFVVHGHDEEARETVARFLEKLGLEAVVLHERASAGRTIIEKIEANSDVGFAVVLLTPDDVGAERGKEDDLMPRARQNVVFELGYFIGKLGRPFVCALMKEGVEKLSDYEGVGYVPMDASGGWRGLLGRELREAGFDIDLNRAY